MILTAAELKTFITTDETDAMITARLKAVELMIRAITNNNFQARAFRAVAVALADGKQLLVNSNPFKQGDTIQISESDLNTGLYTVTAVSSGSVTVSEDLNDESGVLLTKVVYPDDVKMGVVNLIKWDLEKRDKVGIASETISRHSVTYVNMDGDNTTGGYPKALMGFLRPYMKARFGRGI
ncbi:hypothetical protein [Treponema sp.]|uniref:hypothetical protein n=1 Tax=Treponema sp. TaxID=166 RepID=UPI00388E5DAD